MMRTLRVIGPLLLVVLTLASFAPVIGLLVAGAIASTFDCRVDEGSVHPCLVFGHDLGPFLNFAEVLGWLMFVTAPGMVVSLGLWMVILVSRWRRRLTPMRRPDRSGK